MQKYQLSIITVILIFSSSSALAKINPVVKDFTLEVEPAENMEEFYQGLIYGLISEIAREPYNYENYGRLGLIYDYMGDYKNELEALKLNVAYLPDDLDRKDIHYGNLARVYMLNNQWEEGKVWLDKADALYMKNHYNRWNAFDYYIQFKGDPQSAALELKRLSEIYTDEWDIYYEAYKKALDNNVPFQTIIELFKEAVILDPESYLARRTYGVAIRNASPADIKKNMPIVVEELTKALELNPDYIPTYISLADTYLLLAVFTGDAEASENALRWFNKAYAKDPSHAPLAHAMGNFFNYTKEYDKAIAKFEFAKERGLDMGFVNSGLASTYNGKAYAFYQSGENLEEGLAAIDKALKLQPDNGIMLSTKAELLYKLGRYEEAFENIKRSIELEPDHEEIKKDYAMIEAALRESGSAAVPDASKNHPKILEVEQMLVDRGYDPGPVDGILDKQARDAVAQFQMDNGLEVNRFIDNVTWEKLNEVASK